MNLQTDNWQLLPDLNIARKFHSSLGLQYQAYIVCGQKDNDEAKLSSMEIFRPGAEAWELIDIPGFEPRMTPS